MNTSLSWIKAYVPDLDVTAQEYTDAMTLSGTKVEGFEKLDADLDKTYENGVLKQTICADVAADRAVWKLWKDSEEIAAGEISLENGCGEATDLVGKVESWNAEEPNLYRIEVTLFEGEQPVDVIETQIGFRKIENDGKTLTIL